MLKELKAPQKDSTAWCNQSDRLQMAEDTLAAIRRVRRDVVDRMRVLMKHAKDQQHRPLQGDEDPGGDGRPPDRGTVVSDMFDILEDMLRKTKCLCSMLDHSMVEEVFSFLEENRLTVRPAEKDEFSESVAEFMQRNRMRIDLTQINKPSANSKASSATLLQGMSAVPPSSGAGGAAARGDRQAGHPAGPGGGTAASGGGGGNNSLQTPCSEFVSKELRTPEVSDHFYSNVSDLNLEDLGNGNFVFGRDPGEFWSSFSAYTSGESTYACNSHTLTNMLMTCYKKL